MGKFTKAINFIKKLWKTMGLVGNYLWLYGIIGGWIGLVIKKLLIVNGVSPETAGFIKDAFIYSQALSVAIIFYRITVWSKLLRMLDALMFQERAYLSEEFENKFPKRDKAFFESYRKMMVSLLTEKQQCKRFKDLKALSRIVKAVHKEHVPKKKKGWVK